MLRYVVIISVSMWKESSFLSSNLIGPRYVVKYNATFNLQSYSPEDNRFDLRQFLYNARWPYQFRKIDEIVSELDGNKVAVQESKDHEAMAIASDGVGGMGVIAAGSGNPSVGIW